MANKFPCLACEKKIESEMTIEPLPNLPLIKDLVIDRNKVLKKISKLVSHLRKSPCTAFRAGAIDSQDVDSYVKLTSCLECLMCQSACPVLSKKADPFIGPLGLLWLVQSNLIDNSRRDEIRELAKMCTGCGQCWKACPSKIDFLEEAIKGLLNKGET
jgi:succinate dehydrogenase/fumarate reductase iron-sulfur protein